MHTVSYWSKLQRNSWIVDVVTDAETESFVGSEQIKVKQEQTYLGDIITSDGKHTNNVNARKN
jgi:hypothetical protein